MIQQDSDIPCVLCGNSVFSTALRAADFDTGKSTFHLEACGRCGLIRTSPRPTPAELDRYYNTNYYGSVQRKFLRIIEAWTEMAASFQARTMLRAWCARSSATGNPPSVLDVGCGRGTLLRALAKTGCRCTGLERAGFPGERSSTIPVILDTDLLEHDFGSARFDLIILRHVLEHLEQPHRVLDRARNLLAQDGIILIDVPNIGSVQARVFRSAWFHLDLPRHLYHFSPSTLGTMLHNSGLEVRGMNTWTLDQSLFGFIQSTLNATGAFGINSLYNRLKHNADASGTPLLPVQMLIAAALGPFAVAEYLVSGTLGRGSCLSVVAVSRG